MEELKFANAGEFLEKRKLHVESVKAEDGKKWLRESVRARSYCWKYYRALGGIDGLNVEADIRRLRRHLGASAEDQLDCRTIFRFLLRRYALGPAWALHKQMAKHETGIWPHLRLLQFCLPRLFIGVLAGFILQFNEEMMALLRQIASYSGKWVIVTAAVTFVLGISFFFVQRQVGRMGRWDLARRTLAIVGIGAVQSAICGAVIHWVGNELWKGTKGEFHWDFTRLSCLLALLLGLIFQNFWQEGSIGDPL